MKKATVTYNAPEGEAKVVEWLGKTLYSGVGTEVVLDDAMLETVKANQYFKVSGEADYKPEPAKEPPKQKEAESHKEDHGKAHGR